MKSVLNLFSILVIFSLTDARVDAADTDATEALLLAKVPALDRGSTDFLGFTDFLLDFNSLCRYFPSCAIRFDSPAAVPMDASSPPLVHSF